MRYTVQVNAFDGGLNNKVSPIYGKKDESPDLQNVEFEDLGAVSTRRGYTVINSNVVGAFDFLHSYCGEKLIGIYDGLYEYDSAITNFTLIADSSGMISTGYKTSVINNAGYMFFSNGVEKYKWNGTDFTLWGVTPATTSYFTAEEGDSGIAGIGSATTYSYRIAFINSTNVESPVSEAVEFEVSGTALTSTINIPIEPIYASYGVNYVSVYRNDYLLETKAVPISAATVVYDTHEELVTPRDITIDDGRPPNINMVIYHKGYMFGAEYDTNNLYYSEINSPEDWDASNYMRIGNDDCYTIRAINIYNDGLIIAKEDGRGNGNIYVLYMPDSEPDNWTLELLNLSYGGISINAICRFSNFLAILNKNGLYDLSTVQMGVLESKPISFKIGETIRNLVSEHLYNAFMVNYKNKLWLSVPYGAGAQNDIMLQYDYVRGIEPTTDGAWTIFTNMSFKNMCIHKGELYATDYDGYVHKLDKSDEYVDGNNYNDNGSSIDCYYKTMFIHGLDKHMYHMKVWRYIYITVETTGNWDIGVSWNGEYSESESGSTSITLYQGSHSFFHTDEDEDNSAEFYDSGGGVDQDEFDIYASQKTIRIPIKLVSRAIQIKLSINSVNQYFKVHSMSLHYNLRGAR